jgi:CheY-like chemotaxis protein
MSDILFIEDEAWLADCYARWMEGVGYSVGHACSAQAAIDAIDNDIPKLIILDLFLPAANGMQVLHEIKSHSDMADIPVVACSSANFSEVADELKGYGVVVMLDKTTLTPSLLRAAVEEALGEAQNDPVH